MAYKNPQSGPSTENLTFSSESLSQTKNEIAADQLKLGTSYFNTYNIEDNCSIAFKWIKLSAEQGNMEAQFRLAELYSLGQGTSRSHTDAYRWYTKAAIQGYKKALVRIHNLYQNDIEIHCRGKLNSEEERKVKRKNSMDVPIEYFYRELNEQRLDDHKPLLSNTINYYTALFEKCKSSTQEDPEAQQMLGFLYQYGYSVKKYHKWAIEYYTKAAEQGYVDSQYQLGYLYQRNTDIKFNYRKAFYWYKLAAEGGNIAAQNCLAYFYEKGLGTDIDYENALYWYTKSAESGHSGAQVNLGKRYRKGEYVDRNYATAAKWYTLAAQQGNDVAKNCLAQLFQTRKISSLSSVEEISEYCREESKKERLHSRLQIDILEITDYALSEEIKKLAKQALVADGNAMYQIGLKYYQGIGFTENKHIGFRWIKNAANANHEEAMIEITKMYEKGDTVDQNYHKAAIWTKKNARTKSSKALCNLGILYNEGRGVRSDPLEASKWFTLSANQGNSEAQYQLGCLRQEGRGLRKNKEEAREWFYLSAKQGNVNGCYGLGLLLFSKRPNNPKNYFLFILGYTGDETCFKLLEYSSKHGCSHAQCVLWAFYRDSKDPKADFYFDMLLLSNDTSLIKGIFQYSRGLGGISFDYTRTFNLLKKAANLGISDAKEMFYNPSRIRNLGGGLNYTLCRNQLIDIFTFVSDNGISSMEYQLGCLYDHDGNATSANRRHQDLTSATYWYYISADRGDSRAPARLGIICEEGIGVDVNFTEAINYYTLACEKGNKDAMYRFACMHLDGRGVSQDVEKAFRLFTQASDTGHIEARKVLMLPFHALDEDSSEYIHYQRVFVEVNSDNRIKMLETMAESGLVAVQYQLGDFYENEDASKAIKWFTLASQGGVTEAYYRLAILYENGRGTERDYLKAVSYYQKAILNKHEDSMYRLAQIYLYGNGVEVNYTEAYQLYSTAAKLGHTLSCNMIGYYLVPDTDPFTVFCQNENNEKSFGLSSNEFKHSLLMLQHVAEEGDIEAQYRSGVIYDSILDQKDYEEAAKWYSIAVNSSHREAIYRLGLLYEAGLGVTQDYQKAIQLYIKAYKLGNHDALYSLGALYHHNNVTDIDPKRAIQCYVEASNNGHLKSQYALGKLYEEGLLIKKDILEALRWYTRAYSKGYDAAKVDLYAMYDDPPYEDYFFSKLNAILLSVLVVEQPYVSSIRDSEEVKGSIFYKIGLQYLYGSGVAQDDREALNYFKKIDKICGYMAILKSGFIQNSHDKDHFRKILDLYENYFSQLESRQQYDLAMIYYGNYNKPMTLAKSDSNDVNDKPDTIVEIDYKKAITYLEKITGDNSHYRDAQQQLAKMYIQGIGVQKNIEKAIECYNRASSGLDNYALEIASIYHFDNDVRDFSKAITWYKRVHGIFTNKKQGIALNILGLLYKSGDGIKQDYKQALQYFTESASLHDEYACYNLGLMYYYGEGIEKNYTIAYAFFREAAKYNHEKAQMYLSDMYQNGKGVKKNSQEAKKWYLKAFNEKSKSTSIGIVNIEYFTPSQQEEAIKWCKKIEGGDPIICINNTDYSDSIDDVIVSECRGIPKDIMYCVNKWKEYASYNLGKKYYDDSGAQKDYKQAYDYFMKAAETNNSDAYYMLGEMYRYGNGVDRDIEKSIEWYKKVEGDKQLAALNQIATIYLLEDESNQNISRSIEFYTKAASYGDNHASVALGKIYHSSSTVQDFFKAFTFYCGVKAREPSDKGYALRGIGLLFEYGDYVSLDSRKALQYYQKSANLHNKGGYYNMALMYYHGKGVHQDYKECFKALNMSVRTEPDIGHAHVFIRTESHSYSNNPEEKRTYSLERETVLYGEIYFQIGIMYKNGQGTDQNVEKAKECFLKALEYGNEQAKNEIE